MCLISHKSLQCTVKLWKILNYLSVGYVASRLKSLVTCGSFDVPLSVDTTCIKLQMWPFYSLSMIVEERYSNIQNQWTKKN